MEQGIGHGITFYNAREKGSLYRHSNQEKQQVSKFLEKDFPKDILRLNTGKASMSDKQLIKTPSFEHLATRSKPIKSLVSSQRNTDDSHIPINFGTDSNTIKRMLPQLSSQKNEFGPKSAKSLRHRKNSSVGSNPLHLNIPPKSPREFFETPTSDPNRKLLLMAELSEKASNKTSSLTNRNGEVISDAKLDTYRISKFAAEFKELYKNGNPAYDLTMPKDSARRKNMVAKMSHDISHLVDLKGENANRQDLIKFIERLNKENKDFTQRDNPEFDVLSPIINSQPTSHWSNLKSLFSQSLFDISLKKASDFLAFSLPTRRRSEVYSNIKTDTRPSTTAFKIHTERIARGDFAAASNSPSPTHNRNPVDLKDTRYNAFNANRKRESAEEIGEFSHKQLIESLKVTLPNAFTDAPSGRTEVVLLNRWLNTQIETVKSHPVLNLTAKLHRTDEIYDIAFKEVVRQISCECLERGELIMKLWNNYMALYNGLVSDVRSHFAEKFKNQNEEIKRIKDGFHLELERKVQEIEVLSKITHTLELKCEVISREKMEIELKYSQFEDTRGKLKNQIRTMQKQSKILRQEYQDISYKYNKLRNEMHLEEDRLDPEDMLREKFLAMQNNSEKQKDKNKNGQDSDLEEPDSPSKQENIHSSPRLGRFGAIVSKKLEFADKETGIEKGAFGNELADSENQTDLVLAHPRYDELFRDMNAIEELMKEEALKREIQEENVNNLEEDLHAEILEQNLLHFYTREPKENENNAYSGEDLIESQNNISIYSNEATSINFDIDNSKRTAQKQFDTEDLQLNSAIDISSNELDTEGNKKRFMSLDANASEGSNFETNSKNTRVKGSKTLDRHNVTDEDHEEVKSLGSQSRVREFQLEIPRKKYSKTVDARIREMPGKNGKIVLQIPKGERVAQDEVQYSIKENLDESLVSPTIKAGSRKEEALDPAHHIQKRISSKILALNQQRGPNNSESSEPAKFSVTRLQTHVRELFDEENSNKNEEQSEEPGSQKIEADTEKNSRGLAKGKYFENIVLHHMKYIKLMKMLKVEKAKAQELEQKQQALELVVSQDENLLEKIKEALEKIKNGNEHLDKGKLFKAVKDLNDRKKPTDAMQDPNFLTVNDGLADSDFMRVNTRSKTQNLLSVQPMRSDNRTLTSSKIFDDDTAEKKRQESNQNFVRKRTDQKLTTFKANFTGSNLAKSMTSVASSITNTAVVLGKKRESLTVNKKPNAVLETVNKLGRILVKGVKVRNKISLKKILKSITSFLADKIAAAQENFTIKDQDMASFIFTSFLNTYGAPKFAEEKYLRFMASLKTYTPIHRVATFARLCGVSDSQSNWSIDESKQFLNGLEFLITQKNIGMTIPNSETEKRHYTPLARAVEYARQFCEKRGIHSDLAELKRELEKLKEADSSGQNRAGKIKVDLFLEMIVNVYQKYKERAKDYLRWVFEACNFLGRKTLGLDEFLVLVKHIEPEKYEPKRFEELYNSNEEYINSENIGIPFNKFIIIALENDLFSIEKQRRFVQSADDNDVVKNFKNLKEIWEKKKERLEQLIEFNQRLCEPELLTFWTVAMGAFDSQITAASPENKLYLLMKYRILVLEMNSTFSANVPLV